MYSAKEMGRRIRIERKLQDMRQSDLGSAAKISLPFLSDVERGNRGIAVERLIRICEALDRSLEYIVFGEKEEPLNRC